MKIKNNLAFILSAGIFSGLIACSDPEKNIDETDSNAIVIESEKLSFTLDTLHTDFESPWGMTWLPDGRMLVTERKGEILIFKDDKYTGEKLTGVPAIHEVNQAGLLDIAVHPDYENNGWLYLAYAKDMGDGGVLTISRAKLEGNALVDLEELIVNLPEWKGGRHFGTRIVFDNDNYLYYSNGDKGNRPQNAQELDNSHGKIHRIHDDGRIPEDNPFVNTPGAISTIWTYGNRNPQGIIFDKENNRLWSVEHGPKGGDELNLIEKGKNYGWPEITYGIDYDGSTITEDTEKEGMEQPVTYWDPSIATCGMTLVTSDKYPTWKGNILVAALAGQHIARVELDGTNYVGEEKLLDGIGRVRQVSQSPDGYIYAIVEATGLMVKIIPQQD